MNDRLIRGFIAGVVGGIAMNAWSFFAGAMNLTTLRIVDWMSAMLFAHTQPLTFMEIIVGLFVNLAFTGGLGVVFAYLVPPLTSQYLLFKGLVFSGMIWFIIFSIARLFQVPGTTPLSVMTVISGIVAAVFFGLALPLMLQALTARKSATSSSAMGIPAMKPLDDENEEDKR
jgi:hypothetical protein